MRKPVPLEQLPDYIGRVTGPSPWFRVDQQRVDQFAEATLDRQFIHVDPEKAKQGPFAGTIAHGFLTISLIPHFMSSCGIAPAGTTMAVNYGSDKVRFLQPVKVGSELRATAKLLEYVEKAPGQFLFRNEVTVEIKNEKKPALVAEMLTLFVVPR